MLIDSLAQLESYNSKLQTAKINCFPALNSKKIILMASPEAFTVQYKINPHMLNPDGSLKQVDKARALLQWQQLKAKYEELGFQVEVLPAVAGLPDFVFAANQSFPYFDLKTQKPAIILSAMASEFRQPEVDLYRKWYESKSFSVRNFVDLDLRFEGNGDALLDKKRKLIFGGYGFRTDKKAYEALATLTDYPIVRLQLIDERFYHLDTCFAILSDDTVALYAKAFSSESLSLIKNLFPQIIEVNLTESSEGFACNCHSPDQKNVILQAGNIEFEKKLREQGFIPHPLDTSEFMKSGGSVFCMKMEVPAPEL
ncbi:MAG: hypothetical protein KBD78_13790 [Oligoflexales bacterium]|nr:hypothetical protein [Oligoflexales bacterium]